VAFLVGLLAVVSAGLYVLGSAVMQKGILDLDERREISAQHRNYLIALLISPIFLLGIGIELVGYGMHSVALGLGSLSMISILQTSEVVFMLPASRWTAGTNLQRKEYFGAAIVLAGLLGTIFFGQTAVGINDPSTKALAETVVVCWLATLAFTVVGMSVRSLRAALLGCAAGVLFGLVAAITKIVVDQWARDGLASILLDWPFWAMCLSGLAAAGLQVLAFGAGKLSASLSAIIVATPIASVLIGSVLLGESFKVSSSFGWIMLMGSYALCIVGVVILARSPAIAAMHADKPGVPSEV
jgi:drug/metabolite transporter (DMT)-like permease